MKLRFLVETVDGAQQELERPVSLLLTRSADTPADSLKVVFLLASGSWEQEIVRIDLQVDGVWWFRGICDRQIVGIDSEGCKLTVWARSDAAVLLDNEAIPQEYRYISLWEMFEKHLAPYGFQRDFAENSLVLNYQVGKGVSEWDAFSTFCERTVGRRPHIHLSHVLLGLPGQSSHVIAADEAVTAVRHTIRRSEVISQVLLRDELGRYSTALQNGAAQKLKITRRRCMLPSAEWSFPRQDVQLKMQESMRGREQWEIELSKLTAWNLGDEVSGTRGGITFRGNIVYEEFEFSSSGEKTTVMIE